LLTAVIAGCGSKETTARPAEPATPAAPLATPAPEALVAKLYEQHARDESPFFQTKSRALVDEYFEPTLAELIWKDAVAASGEVGALEFDPLYDAQDTDIKTFVIQPGSVEGENARVVVTFENLGEKKQLTYSLVLVGGSWKIADIAFGEGRTLRGVYSEVTPATESSGT
jgi:hypothetical protein